ncbi:MAG: hypothetical protein KDA61_06055 [Planctomycetales bacterium]|nr:hypothetical protein [Planctomycetales bacterium]
MLNALFNSSSLPALEQVVGFTQARHGVLAGNIANLDTPGYLTRDLSPTEFQSRLRDALHARDRALESGEAASPGLTAGRRPDDPYRELSHVRDDLKSIVYHDESDVSLEKQVAEIAKNQAQHNMALTIMTHQFQLLQAAISERA